MNVEENYTSIREFHHMELLVPRKIALADKSAIERGVSF
jgi:hypothetical protein